MRKDHGAENLAVLRHIALDLHCQEKTAKAERKIAAWDENYLRKSWQLDTSAPLA